MIKLETIGMLDRVVVNPVIKSETDVKNYDFITYDDEVYLVSNTLTGDDAYKEDATLAAGEYLNGHLLKSLEGQKLVIDGKHVTGGIDNLDEGDVLVAADDGTLETGDAAGVHLVVTDTDVTLTEAAIKAKVVVAAEAADSDANADNTEAQPGGGEAQPGGGEVQPGG